MEKATIFNKKELIDVIFIRMNRASVTLILVFSKEREETVFATRAVANELVQNPFKSYYGIIEETIEGNSIKWLARLSKF